MFTGPGGFPTTELSTRCSAFLMYSMDYLLPNLMEDLDKSMTSQLVESESLGTRPEALSGNQFLAVSYSDQCLRTSHPLGARILDSPPFEWKNKTVSSSYQTIFI